MLEKRISYDGSWTEWGHIQVRQITRILEDGKEISKTYHRHVLSPGDDIKNEDEVSKKVAQAIWTPEVIAAYKEMVKEREDKEKNTKAGD